MRKQLKKKRSIDRIFSPQIFLKKHFCLSADKPIHLRQWYRFFDEFQAQLSHGQSIFFAFKQLSRKKFHPLQQILITEAMGRLMHGHYVYPLFQKKTLGLTSQQAQLLQCAEIGGYFAHGLNQVNSMLELQIKIRQKIQQALLYPALLLVIAFLFCCIICFLLLPQIEIFLSQQAIATNHFTYILLKLNHHITPLLLIFIITLSICLYILRCKRISFWQLFSLLFKRHNKLLRYSLFAADFSELLKNNLPLLKSLQLALNNLPKTVSYNQIVLILQTGENLSNALTGLPEDFRQAIAAAEIRGNLSQTLRHLSETYYRQFENQLFYTIRWIEPISILLISILVFLGIAAAFYPIFQIFQSLNLDVF